MSASTSRHAGPNPARRISNARRPRRDLGGLSLTGREAVVFRAALELAPSGGELADSDVAAVAGFGRTKVTAARHQLVARGLWRWSLPEFRGWGVKFRYDAGAHEEIRAEKAARGEPPPSASERASRACRTYKLSWDDMGAIA